MAIRVAVFVMPLGLDTFAVAVALGLRGLHPLRPALLFSFFEAVMPIVGILVGRYVGLRIGTLAIYVGAIVLIGIGLHVLHETRRGEEHANRLSFESAAGMSLAGLGISIDELAMGFPLGALGLPIGAVVVAIAVQAFLVTASGIVFGRRVGAALGRSVSRTSGIVAGVAFVLLGAYLLFERLVQVG